MLKVHAVHNTHGPRGDEVARDHADGGARHGCIGQALAESGFNFVAQLAGGLLGAVQRQAVGDAHTVGVLGRMAFGQQLLIHLWAKAVNQHHFHTHTLDECQVLHQAGQFARRDGFASDGHHKGFAAVHVDIGCDRSKPRDEGEIENS